MSNRPEITMMLSISTEMYINPHGDPRIYWAKEVTFDYATSNAVRVDYMKFKPVNNTVSGIEKGDFYCYEVKSSVEDFHSKNGHNFIGDFNYYVMPEDVYEKVKDEIADDAEKQVWIEKCINIKTLSDFTVSCSYGDDFIAGMLSAAAYKSEEVSQIDIVRGGKLFFSFRIHALGEEEANKSRKKHTKYVRNKQIGVKFAEETDNAKFRSSLIYHATVEEDRNKLWDNKQVWNGLIAQGHQIVTALDVIEAVLLGGEKDRMLSSASQYLEDKHYQAKAAIDLLVEPGNETDMTTGLNAMYADMQSKIESLGKDLHAKVNVALEDGVITLDEQDEITNLQNQITDITNQISQAETEASFQSLKIKYSGASLDSDSFANLVAEIQTNVQEAAQSYDDALEVSLTNLNLQLQSGAINQEQFDAQLQALTEGYQAKITDLSVRVESFELQSIADAFGSELDGILPDIEGTVAEKLGTAMHNAMAAGVDVENWDVSTASQWLDLPN